MMSFFVPPPVEGLAQLTEEDAKHALKSLRMRPGEHLAIACEGQRYEAELVLKGQQAYARIIGPLPDSEARCRVTLYQGLPKGDKMDAIVQKCCELGVHRIVPCQFSRSVARWEGGDKKLLRWRRIAREAAMQAGRALLPEVADCLSFEQLCAALPLHQQALVAWEGGGLPLSRAWQGQLDVALVIGPEGGISPEEVNRLKAQPLTLGPRVLRTETAGMAAIAMLLSISGDMA